MDCLGPHSPTEMAVLMFGAQTGKTEASMNVLAFTIVCDPGPILYVSPTTELMKRSSRQRIAPMFDETPALRELVAQSRARDEASTILMRDFPAGTLVMTGANSAVGLRSMPARVVIADEVDAYPIDIDGEGAPLELALKRQSTFPNKKTWVASTPTVKDASRIEQLYDSSDRRRYFVPCPHCGEHQVLKWANLRWNEGDPESARYACEHCGSLIEERHKTALLAGGQWRAEHPERGDRVAGFQLNALYSPLGWISWADLVREFLAATAAVKRGDVSLLRVFINTRLAESFAEGASPTSTDALAERAEEYPLGEVPAAVLCVTAGVDVQDDRIEAYAWGWGRNDESWLCDFRRFNGSPAEPTVWQDLARYLEAELPHPLGKLRIAAAGIDSGHFTAEVYRFTFRQRNWFALKGSPLSSQPVIGRPSAVEKAGHVGSRVYPVGTDTAKTLLYGRLAIAQAGPGFVHVSEAVLDDVPDFFEQLTCERRVQRFRNGRPIFRWIKPSGRRNEALDCAVYALAAFHGIGGHRFTEEGWGQLERQLAGREDTGSMTIGEMARRLNR
jgi:phage terminase large subunit GpA-like protein